jgi:hypothetical protein
MPPIEGLQDIWPSVSMLWVSNSVAAHPADARAAWCRHTTAHNDHLECCL